MGGGITLALALVFILDGIIGFIPGFENIGFWAADPRPSGLSGHGETANGLGAAIIGSIAWVAIVLGPGWVRFVRGDLK